jgi:catechol 2,3-dioxygenase-like lactoylglutathione lyase family enzyme
VSDFRRQPLHAAEAFDVSLLGFDHVNLAIPVGAEDVARAFYGGVLGMREVPKPEAMAGRGGAWFVDGPVTIHLSREDDFRPARKAHPALLVDDLAAMIARCEAAGAELRRDVPLAGYERIHVFDPFGNRIELMQRTPSSGAESGR